MNITFVTSSNNENHFFSTLKEAQTDLETGIDFYKKEKISGTIYNRISIIILSDAWKMKLLLKLKKKHGKK